MRRTIAGVILSIWSALGWAHTPSRLADVAIIDRDSGTRLEMHYFRGEWWVAGRPGSRYAIFVRNRSEERLLTVASVDGINVITGEDANWGQDGYVFAAGSEYEITGWRKNDRAVAAFAFSAPSDSYATRTGRPQNLGVIGLALFRERSIPATAIASPPEPAPAPRAEGPGAPAPTELAQSPNAMGGLDSSARARMPPSAISPALGTAHGEREYSYVERTTFARLHTDPDEMVHIRYDSRENLIAMGIIRAPRYYPAPRPDPFPGSETFVPDPPPG
jgi:hypothetical protein